jgi:transposase InsO family protein
MQDDLTKWSVAVPIDKTDANSVAQAFVENFILIYGIPESILTDKGTNFMGNVFKEICKILKITKLNTIAYNPASNGALERSHRTLKDYLKNFVDKDQLNWDTFVKFSMHSYNTTPHTSTNFTPHELVFGVQPQIPSSLMKNPESQYNYDNYAFDMMKKLQETNKIDSKNKNKRLYNKNTN